MKRAFFFIDDTIWVIRDIARQKPASIFDNRFMKILKNAHDNWGLTVQLNLFYRTDFFYGSDEFTLADMPDTYKAEFEENSDWLKFAFHAKQEFPDYPYINATYDDVKNDYMAVVNEIKRFAGEKSIANVLVPHWLPVSKAGCRALADCGVRLTSVSYGNRKEYDPETTWLPYGHAARLLQNRQPETMLFTRNNKNPVMQAAVCAYNHLEEEDFKKCSFKNNCILDKETGIYFTAIGGGPCLNSNTKEEVEAGIDLHKDDEYLGICVHEQYFYPDYYAYQPDMEEKVYAMARKFKEHGFTCVTADDIKTNIVK